MGFGKPSDSQFSSPGAEGSVGEDVVGGRTSISLEGGPDVRQTYVKPANANPAPAKPGAPGS